MEGAGTKSMEDIRELFKEMIATFMNQSLEGELDEELGYSQKHKHVPSKTVHLVCEVGGLFVWVERVDL